MLKKEIDKQRPAITVLMSVYNTDETYLRSAIESILNQTFSDFEFLIFDDASDESTKKVLHSYDDDRICLITNNENCGLTRNLNRGLQMAKGKYIARMDADDISYPQRFEKCYNYFEKYDKINILGTYVKVGKRTKKSFKKAPRELKRAIFLITNAGPMHPSVMMRRAFLENNHIKYDETFLKAQDYDLWARCIELTDIHILPEVLVCYRIHEKQISSGSSYTIQQQYADRVKIRLFRRICPNISEGTFQRFVSSRLTGEMEYDEYKRLAKKIIDSNKKHHVYKPQELEYIMQWYVLKYIKNRSNGHNKVLMVLDFFLHCGGFRFIKNMMKYGIIK